MRSDYILYGIAVIFFILTGTVLAIQIAEQQLWIMTTAVLGFLFIGLGYSQKPRARPSTIVDTVSTPIMTAPTSTLATAPPPQMPQPVAETVVEPIKEPILEQVTHPETLLASMDITQVKGVKQKRAEQLKSLGINNLQDLANASAEELGKNLQISPKITTKWIEQAKQLAQKS